MKFRCRVERMQVWYFDIEADSESDAKDKADRQSWDEPAHDDYSYDIKAMVGGSK